MSTMNISLPGTLKAYVDEQVDARGYGTSSEYVRELIRRDQERQRLRGLLLAGAASAPGSPADGAHFEVLRARVRRDAGSNGSARRGVSGKPLIAREQADRDLEEAIAQYLAEAGERERHSTSSTPSSGRIATSRGIPRPGSARYAHGLDLPGLRVWPPKCHPYRVFYVERDEHIDISRVLHGKRDLLA